MLSFYTHIFQFLASSSEEVLKVVIRNNDVLIFVIVDYRKYIRKYLVFTNSIARTYFNQSQCNFRILNPCRRLCSLLDLASDKHRILYICIYIAIYFCLKLNVPLNFTGTVWNLFWHSLCTYCSKILRWFSVPKFRQLTWTISVTHWLLGGSYCRLWV